MSWVGKGLESGALGSGATSRLASQPAYRLAATLGYVVLAVGDKARPTIDDAIARVFGTTLTSASVTSAQRARTSHALGNQRA